MNSITLGFDDESNTTFHYSQEDKCQRYGQRKKNNISYYDLNNMEEVSFELNLEKTVQVWPDVQIQDLERL